MKKTGKLARTGGLNQRSERTQTKYTEQRIPLVKAILTERPFCEACEKYAERDGVVVVKRRSVDCHEVLSRGRSGGVSGTAWLDPANILAVCRICHIRITAHPSEAEQLGLLTKVGYGDTMN